MVARVQRAVMGMTVVSGAFGLEEGMPMIVEGSSERKGCLGAVADVFVVALTEFLEGVAGDDGANGVTGSMIRARIGETMGLNVAAKW